MTRKDRSACGRVNKRPVAASPAKRTTNRGETDADAAAGPTPEAACDAARPPTDTGTACGEDHCATATQTPRPATTAAVFGK
jgi:hypothetical protein